MGPKIFECLGASVVWVTLLPVDSRFRETEDVDVVCEHALAEVLKIYKIVLGGDTVGILE